MRLHNAIGPIARSSSSRGARAPEIGSARLWSVPEGRGRCRNAKGMHGWLRRACWMGAGGWEVGTHVHCMPICLCKWMQCGAESLTGTLPMAAGTVVSLFDYTGIMVEPWVQNGYAAHLVDIRHPLGTHAHPTLPNTHIHGCRVEEFCMPQNVTFAAAFPPCTDLSGARRDLLARKLADGRSDAAGALGVTTRDAIVQAGARWWAIENPVGAMPRYLGPPTFRYDPYEYRLSDAERYTKRTCIWANFQQPPRRYTSKSGLEASFLESPLNRGGRAHRSDTPRGFAHAVYWWLAHGRRAPGPCAHPATQSPPPPPRARRSARW